MERSWQWGKKTAQKVFHFPRRFTLDCGILAEDTILENDWQEPLLQRLLLHNGVKEKHQPLYQKLVLNMAKDADFDTKRKIKRQQGNWVHFSFGWVQNVQSKTVIGLAASTRV